MAMRQYQTSLHLRKRQAFPQDMEYKDLLNESIEKKKAHKTMVRLSTAKGGYAN